LFHLCEFADARSAGRRMDDAQVLRLFHSRLRPAGLLMFYKGSFGYPRARPLIAQLLADGLLSFVEEYASLEIYRADSVPQPGQHPPPA
jgi:hypothetical protein